MADPIWPPDLPQEWFTSGGPKYTPADNTIRTAVGAGPAKLRRRFTAQTEDLSLQNILCEDEMAILSDFVKNTLGEISRFTWTDFRTGYDAAYRFKAGWSSVTAQHYGDDLWTVTLALELQP